MSKKWLLSSVPYSPLENNIFEDIISKASEPDAYNTILNTIYALQEWNSRRLASNPTIFGQDILGLVYDMSCLDLIIYIKELDIELTLIYEIFSQKLFSYKWSAKYE